MSLHHSPSIVTDGLVLYLDAGNRRSYPGTGDVWYDLSSIMNSGLLIDGPFYTKDNLGCINYDGINDYCRIGTNIQSLTQITLEVVINSNILNTMMTRSVTVANAFILHHNGAGFYLVSSDNVASNYLAYQDGYKPIINKWNYIVATWNGNIMKLYLNGNKQPNELVYTGGLNGTLADISSIHIGGYFNVSQPWTNGKISMFKIYKKALTDQEIRQNFKAIKSRYNL